MIECPVPQDILKYEAKVVGGFAAREAVCIFIGGVMGLAAFFTIGSNISDITIKIIITALFALPGFVVGFVKPLGQPFEKIIWIIIQDNFLTPVKLPKEIHHPELEKYEKTRQWMLSSEFLSEEENADKTKKKKKNKKNEIKVKPSKQFKAMR